MRLSSATLSILLLTITVCCMSEPEPSFPIDSCETLISNFDAALNVYNADKTNRAKCIQVKEAGALLLDCPSLSEGQKADYKSTMDAIYCN